MDTHVQPPSKSARWAGLIMSGLVILFLLFDGGIKLVPLEIVIVDKMENAGLVQRQTHPVDRRVSMVGVTELGAARLDEFRSRRNAWLSVRLDELDPAELALLADATAVLERIVDQPEPTADDGESAPPS